MITGHAEVHHLDPTGLSNQVIERWGVAGVVLVVCGLFMHRVFMTMSKKIQDTDAAAQNREKEMAARINALEAKMLDEVMEVVRASHQLMVETKVALASNTEAMHHLCQKIDTNFGVVKKS